MISQVIKILPDSVANQIAAGEVVQRPSSVVKELIENSIDAFAKHIKVRIIDAGKTSIQVIDDGCGMSEIDARLAFERHATSKITDASDLFAIATFGFRGEALASIASVAQVELITRREQDEFGTKVEIHGSKFIKQDSIVCSIGTTITVKNLFFNIPARRRFLKSDTIEFKHIVDEFLRVALAHPDISFSLIHNNLEIYNLNSTSLKQRIIHVFGKQVSSELLDISVDTNIVNIRGFIGKPDVARKKNSMQYFFVNNRYIRHPFLYRVILNAYDRLLLPETMPSYFIYFSCDPQFIDVNIHPTKTEIKFEDERAVAQILEACVKQTLGKMNILPNIDFENESSISLPNIDSSKIIQPPKITINTQYNPFEPKATPNWKKIFDTDIVIEKQHADLPESIVGFEDQATNPILQIKDKYLLVVVKSGLMLIDQHRAHERVLYELLMKRYMQEVVYTEKLIFPETIELTTQEVLIISDLLPFLKQLGFHTTIVQGTLLMVEEIPSYWIGQNTEQIIRSFLQNYIELEKTPTHEPYERFLLSMARSMAIRSGTRLLIEERQQLFDELFSTSNPQYTPDGKTIFAIISLQELEKLI